MLQSTSNAALNSCLLRFVKLSISAVFAWTHHATADKCLMFVTWLLMLSPMSAPDVALHYDACIGKHADDCLVYLSILAPSSCRDAAVAQAAQHKAIDAAQHVTHCILLQLLLRRFQDSHAAVVHSHDTIVFLLCS